MPNKWKIIVPMSIMPIVIAAHSDALIQTSRILQIHMSYNEMKYRPRLTMTTSIPDLQSS
jgi:hypothetical protein